MAAPRLVSLVVGTLPFALPGDRPKDSQLTIGCEAALPIQAQAAPTARLKVPMRRRGADCLVVALKRGNARGAKGAGHRHWIGSTDNGRSLIISGRRQPSSDGTSRMNREVHVRICERLGVKFPGPTRHEQTIAGGVEELHRGHLL